MGMGRANYRQRNANESANANWRRRILSPMSRERTLRRKDSPPTVTNTPVFFIHSRLTTPAAYDNATSAKLVAINGSFSRI
jgi:hypothetical protein